MILYFSNKCPHCKTILAKIQDLPDLSSKMSFISIDSQRPQHPIKSVPSLILDNSILSGKSVFDWFDNQTDTNNTLPAFEMGFGNNNFSVIDGPGIAQKNHNFTFLGGDSSELPAEHSTSKKSNKPQKIPDDAMDRLIKERSNDIPVPRTRS